MEAIRTEDGISSRLPRTIAIGDIHGCSTALASILLAIDPQPEDTIITLGDYVNRGMDSKGVLDVLIELSGRCRLIPILGNHDEMMLKARTKPISVSSFFGIRRDRNAGLLRGLRTDQSRAS